MRRTDELMLTSDEASAGTGRGWLSVRGSSEAVAVDGTLLEQQFRCAPGYLVLTTQDCPFEETLHLQLLDGGLACLDAIEIAQPYTPGALGEVEIVAADALRFSFFGGDRWLLRVRNAPRRSIRRLPRPASRRMRPWAPRWLELTLISVPERARDTSLSG